MIKRLILVAVCAAAVLGSSSRAFAGEGDLNGPSKFDLKLGPSISVISPFGGGGSQFRLEFHYGYNLTPGQPYHIYLDLPLNLGLGNNLTALGISPGIEADILLPVGVPLYLYPMMGIGVAFGFPGVPGVGTQTGFDIRFGGGIKYVLNGMWNFFFEPFNLDIVATGWQGGAYGSYNLLFGAGINF